MVTLRRSRIQIKVKKNIRPKKSTESEPNPKAIVAKEAVVIAHETHVIPSK